MKSKKTTKTVEPRLPSDVRQVVTFSAKTLAQWNNLTPIARRDFISWIETAKLPATRVARIKRIPSMLASGKRRPCCYAVVPMNFYRALGTNARAKATWRTLSPSERRDYIEWVNQAKKADESNLRVSQSCRLLASGKRKP